MNLRRFLERLVLRAGPNANSEPGNVLTIISVVYSTEAKTFSGPAVYITQAGPAVAPPAPVAPTPSGPAAQDPQPTESSVPTATEQADTPSSPASQSSPSDSQPTDSSVLNVTSSPTAPVTSPVVSTPGVDAASGTSATPTAEPTSGGMSGGAKAGLAFGIILGLAFIGVGVFYLYRRQKQKHEAHERLDDEKMAMTYPDVLPRHPEPEMAAAVPQLSLRPITQFNPNLAGTQQDSAPGGIPASASASDPMPTGAAAAIAAATATNKGTTGLRQPGLSAWERPGSRNAANDPANPFGNHAETIASPPNGSRPSTAQAPAQAPSPSAVPIRAPSPQDVNPADFPLPSSGPSSPNASSFDPNVNGQPKGSDGPSSAVTGAVAGAVAGAAIATAITKDDAPKKSGPTPGPVHRVQLDFIPSMEDELEIHTGQLLRIKHEYDDGWALCEFMDGSKSGVVPRSCLSKAPLKPRPTNGPPPSRPPIRGPPPPVAIPRPLTPGGGRNSPVPGVHVPRPLTPTGRNSPAPYARSPGPMSPAGRTGRARANSNASPYVAYTPQGRSMSPGPYGPGQPKPAPNPDLNRRRSKSVSQLSNASAGAVPASPQAVVRKPVGGHKLSDSS